MSTITDIVSYARALPPDSIFTTRELLSFGSRSAVDNAIYRLVHRLEIVRIIPGVFRLPDSTRVVTLEELAIVKARSFGRQLIKHASDIVSELGIAPGSRKPGEVWFATNGSNSAFTFGSTKIYFKQTSSRRMELGDSPFGQVVRALSSLGRKKVSADTVALATANLAQGEIGRGVELAAFMPAWLSEFFRPAMRAFYSTRTSPSFVQEPTGGPYLAGRKSCQGICRLGSIDPGYEPVTASHSSGFRMVGSPWVVSTTESRKTALVTSSSTRASPMVTIRLQTGLLISSRLTGMNTRAGSRPPP